MPIRIEASGSVVFTYQTPFIGPMNHSLGIAVDLSALTNKEIDSKGYLKPGIPLTSAGALLTVGDTVFGVTIEPLKVAADNAAATIAALGTIEVGVAVIGVVHKAITEDNLNRVLTADEIAGFGKAGCHLILAS